jgi:hypothetical protein
MPNLRRLRRGRRPAARRLVASSKLFRRDAHLADQVRPRLWAYLGPVLVGETCSHGFLWGRFRSSGARRRFSAEHRPGYDVGAVARAKVDVSRSSPAARAASSSPPLILGCLYGTHKVAWRQRRRIIPEGFGFKSFRLDRRHREQIGVSLMPALSSLRDRQEQPVSDTLVTLAGPSRPRRPAA